MARELITDDNPAEGDPAGGAFAAADTTPTALIAGALAVLGFLVAVFVTSPAVTALSGLVAVGGALTAGRFTRGEGDR